MQHAQMLLRVYVDSLEQFEQWVQEEKIQRSRATQ